MYWSQKIQKPIIISKKDSQFYILIDSKLDYDTVYGNVNQFIELYQLFVPLIRISMKELQFRQNWYGWTNPSSEYQDEFDRYYDVEKR